MEHVKIKFRRNECFVLLIRSILNLYVSKVKHSINISMFIENGIVKTFMNAGYRYLGILTYQ